MSDMYYTAESAGITFMIVYLMIILVALTVAAAIYVLTCIPLFQLAKKHGHARPWFAFVPFANTWLLADLGGKKPLFLLGDNVVIKDRFVSVIVLVVVSIFVAPVWGLFFYAYLRDVLYLYEADHAKARNTAMIVSLLDLFLTGGLARAVILFTKIKEEPVAVAVENPPIPEKAFVF